MKKYTDSIKIIIVGVLFSFGIGFVFAQWAGPTESPFGGNTPAPVNVGDSTQTKTGTLWVDTFLATAGGFFAQGPAEFGGTITIGGGEPGAGKVLVAEDSAGAAVWSGVESFSCQRRSGISSNSSTASVSCVPGEILTGGGGDCGNRTINYSRPHATQQRWEVQCSQLSTSVSATAICCLPQLRFLDTQGPEQP